MNAESVIEESASGQARLRQRAHGSTGLLSWDVIVRGGKLGKIGRDTRGKKLLTFSAMHRENSMGFWM